MKLFANLSTAAAAKLMSLEFLASAIVAIFITGVVWANLNSSIAEAQAATTTNQSKLEVVQEDVTEIKKDVALIVQRQEHYQETQKDLQAAQTEELKEQRADIKKIISILGRDIDGQ